MLYFNSIPHFFSFVSWSTGTVNTRMIQSSLPNLTDICVCERNIVYARFPEEGTFEYKALHSICDANAVKRKSKY